MLFFGSLNPRRERLIEDLRAAGLSVELVVGSFAEELTPAIKRARLVLHAHFYASGLFPVTRVLQPVVQGVPIVCEKSVFAELSDWSQSGILFAPSRRASSPRASTSRRRWSTCSPHSRKHPKKRRRTTRSRPSSRRRRSSCRRKPT